MYALPRNAFCQVGVPDASLGARWCGSLLLCDAQFVPLARVATIGTIRQVAAVPVEVTRGLTRVVRPVRRRSQPQGANT